MMNHAKDEEPITEEKVGQAAVSGWFWLSNFIVNNFVESAKNANNLVNCGE